MNARLEQTSDTHVLQALRSQTHQLVTAAAGGKDVQAVLEASSRQLANSNSYSAAEQKQIVSGWKDVNSKIQQKKETRLERRLSNAALILQQEGAAGHEFAHRNEVIQLSLCTSHTFSRCVSHCDCCFVLLSPYLCHGVSLSLCLMSACLLALWLSHSALLVQHLVV